MTLQEESDIQRTHCVRPVLCIHFKIVYCCYVGEIRAIILKGLEVVRLKRCCKFT